MHLPSLLNLLVRRIAERVPVPRWKNEEVGAADRAWLHNETTDSPFDTAQLRKKMWEKMKRGDAELVCRRCVYGKVLCIRETGSPDPIPWDDWGRIFALFYEGTPFRVGFFAATAERHLPAGTAVGPECVNGGYTMPCQPNSIVVYRVEEATRVLIHELFHATCTDRTSLSLPLREAETEAWAEWVLVAFRANGDVERARQLFSEQVAWVSRQNAVLRKQYGIVSAQDYVWRYTVGREAAYRRLGYEGPFSAGPPQKTPFRSGRLSSPTLD